MGNGSVPAKGIHRSLFDILTKDRKLAVRHAVNTVDGTKWRHCHFPNPFKCIPMLFKKGNLTVIMIGSITYTVKMTLQTSLAAQCIDIYQLDYLHAGLIYLPSGVGGALAAYTTGKSKSPHSVHLKNNFEIIISVDEGIGKFLDWNLKRSAARHGRDEGYHRGDDISDFPIERARFAGIQVLIAISAAGTAAYGAVLNQRTVRHARFATQAGCTHPRGFETPDRSCSTSQRHLSCSSSPVPQRQASSL